MEKRAGERKRTIETDRNSLDRLFLEGTSLFVAGNQSRGRLSQPTIADDLIPDDYIPSIQQLTQATIVHLPEGTGTIKEMAVGFEHALLLSGELPFLSYLCQERGVKTDKKLETNRIG